jgi:hypothetical protein
MLKLKSQPEEVDNGTVNTARKPHTWWQWLLLYPALIITLISSVPTYLELFWSFKLGVPYGQSDLAKQQNYLWGKNFSCTKAETNWVRTENNYDIDATICDSGDILVWVKGPRGEPRATWVPVDGLIDSSRHAFFVSSAFADMRDTTSHIDQSGGTVICQRFIGQGRLLRRIQTSNGCFDQVINTYTGQVIQQGPAPCNPNC